MECAVSTIRKQEDLFLLLFLLVVASAIVFMEAMICMECAVSTIRKQEDLFLLLFLLVDGLLLTLGGLGVSLLLAWPHSAPLGKLGLGSLGPLSELLFPHGLEPLAANDLGAALVQLLPVAVGPSVRPPLVLGEHVDGGGVGTAEGLGVESL